MPQQRDARARPPGLVAERLRPAPDPPAPRGRLPLDPGRRAAHLDGPECDRLRPRRRGRHPSRGRDRAGREPDAAGDDRAVLHVGRLLRDPSRVRAAELGPRRALRPAGAEPPRHPRDPRGHGLLQGQRPLARRRDRLGPERASPRRPRREHPDRLHDRPRPRVPAGEGDAVRPRDRGDDDHARPRRLPRRQGDRVDGQPSRRLPDALRARRGADAGVRAGGVAAAARHRRSRRDPRRRLHRDDLPRRLRAAARDPDRALEVHPPLRRLRPAGARQLRRQRHQGPPGVGRLGRSDRPARGARTISCSTPTRAGTSPTTRPTAASARELAGRLDEWMEATDDPLLAGPVEAPPGAIVNRQDQVSPAEPAEPGWTPAEPSGAVR